MAMEKKQKIFQKILKKNVVNKDFFRTFTEFVEKTVLIRKKVHLLGFEELEIHTSRNHTE